MKVVLSQCEGTLFLSAMRDSIEASRAKPKSPWVHLYKDVEALGQTYRRHGFGLVTFITKASALHTIKETLVHSGQIKTSEQRMMVMRLNEALSLFYKATRDVEI